MTHITPKISSILKIGMVLFCFMCLFFATYMASRYESQKAETEIQASKVKELEEKIHELSAINQELLQIRSLLAQEKEQMVKEINALQEKCHDLEGWKDAIEKEM
jgi:Na+-transporting methylmalonyl-CoA/oxaloacetate decarboxylase gamma subunit